MGRNKEGSKSTSSKKPVNVKKEATDKTPQITKPKKVPLAMVVEGRDQLTLSETILSKFYRCEGFPMSCSFHSNDLDDFLAHLGSHSTSQLKCYYCGVSSSIFKTPDNLVTHMLMKHGWRNFQCNLCPYRCTRHYQMHIHHIAKHTDNFYAQLDSSSLSNMSNGNNGQAPKATKNLMPSKVIICKPLVSGPMLHESYIFAYQREDRKNAFGDFNDHFQCLFCPLLEKDEESMKVHVCLTHPDLPVLFYPPGRQDVSKPPEVKQEEQQTQRPEFVEKTEEVPNNIPSIPGLEPDPSARVHIRDQVKPPKKAMIEYRPEDTLDQVLQTNPIDTSNRHENCKDREVSTVDSQDVQRDLDLSDEDVFEEPKSQKKSDTSGDDSDSPQSLKRMRSRVDYSNVIQEIQKPTPKANPNINMKKCLLCPNQPLVLASKIKFHMTSIHRTDSSMKCGDCDYIGGKLEVKQHIRQNHNGNGTIILVMIPVEDSEPTIVEVIKGATSSARRSISTIEPIPLTRNPSTSTGESTRKRRKSGSEPQRGQLMEELKSSTYLGPARNQRTEKGEKLMKSKKK